MFGGHCPAVLGTLRSATPHLWQQGLGNGQRPRILGKKGMNAVLARKATARTQHKKPTVILRISKYDILVTCTKNGL